MEVELQLAGARDAGISNVAFSPTAHDLLVSTWDGALTLYDADENVVRRRCDAHQAPVLDCCFTDDGRAVSASADRSVKLWDLAAGSAVTLGLHNQPVKCVEHAAARQRRHRRDLLRRNAPLQRVVRANGELGEEAAHRRAAEEEHARQ